MHVSGQQMLECVQSAYREKRIRPKQHCTCFTCTYVYVTSAVKTVMRNIQGTILVLVDFSSAFNLLNDDILIRQLRLGYGFVDKELDCQMSYL